MQQALNDFFNILKNGIYTPLLNALQNNSAFNGFYNYIGQIISSIFGVELNNIGFGSTVIASGFTIYIAIISITFVIKLLKNSLTLITGVFDYQFGYDIKRRRKRK